MRVRDLTSPDGVARRYAVVLEQGDETIATLTDIARRKAITGAALTGIGAFSRATLGWYDLDRMDYERIEIDEQVELLSLVGDVALDRGEPKIHAHVTIGCRDGSARGGHLLEATVRPTLEVVVTESPVDLRRTWNPNLGLALIDLDRSG